MEQQLKHITQIITSDTAKSTSNDRDNQRSPSIDLTTASDLEEDYSEADRTEDDEEHQSDVPRWGRCLPAVNTPESNGKVPLFARMECPAMFLLISEHLHITH